MTLREQKFIATVWEYYQAHGRHDLPWRKTTNPYCILVSEIMLQQTQVARVVPKYTEFLKRFPSTKALAEAPLGDVLRVWQGLGYNRRAKYVKEAAAVVHKVHHGRWPRTAKELQLLPGIGPYTAGAVAAFAYNEGVPIIETNIRTVYLHHFFHNQTKVPDQEVLDQITKTLDVNKSRQWYWALMDYGSHLKQLHGNQNHRSESYTKQSRFAGSDRQLRGQIIRILASESLRYEQILGATKALPCRVQLILADLIVEGLVVCRKGSYYLP